MVDINTLKVFFFFFILKIAINMSIAVTCREIQTLINKLEALLLVALSSMVPQTATSL